MRALLLGLAIVVATARHSDACLWDYDTLKEESLGQADVAAVVTGDLKKHSSAFYEAKSTYTRAIIDKGDAPKDRYDDLAVALAKSGTLDDAIKVLDDKEKLFPGEYTTQANLGTFFAMKGDIKLALHYLKKAIAINPDAHFGREKYQIQLLGYLEKLAGDATLASKENFLGIDAGKDGFAGNTSVIINMSGRGAKQGRKAPSQPVAAIVGLMQFGDGQDSPHLWWALAWALIEQGNAQLALRALRRAEVLGHARAGEDGIVLSTVPRHGSKAGPCCPQATDPKARKQWATMSKQFDADWKRGQSADLERQRAEDARISKKQWKTVFGY